jgi:hypothetical protein
VVITDVQAVSNREQREIRLERNGWMTKQGARSTRPGFTAHKLIGGGSKSTFSRKTWKERWFVLKGGVLTYSKTVGSPALGEIQIKSIVDVGAADATDTTVREFSIVTDERNYHFRCHTHEDCMVCLGLCTWPLRSAPSGMGSIAAQGAGRRDGCHGHWQR